MISVEEARARILASVQPLPAETVSVSEAMGRVLAEDVIARVTQPPAAVSAMDGWAVRADDLAPLPVSLRRVGEAPAGHPFQGSVGPGEAVRIFTGATVPNGADTVVLQEDCDDQGATVLVREGGPRGRWVRPAGLDFARGDVGLKAGRRLGARDIGLAAAMNVPWLSVRRRPVVAILATGDEVVMPGDPLATGQIVSSNGLALAAFVRGKGGIPVNLGIARDTRESLAALVDGVRGADLLLTTGGASVGDHDLVSAVLGERGLALDFWKIAMRPGKPLMFGHIGGVPMLGLPGNPVSSLVCAHLFARPLLRALQGLDDGGVAKQMARLGTDLPANDRRQDYLRAALGVNEAGMRVATPFPKQDSSMMTRLAWADCLVVRPPNAPPASKGDLVEIVPLDEL